MYALKLVGNLAATVAILCVLIEPSSKRRCTGARNLATVCKKYHKMKNRGASTPDSEVDILTRISAYHGPHGRTWREDRRLGRSFDLTQSRDCSFPAGGQKI